MSYSAGGAATVGLIAGVALIAVFVVWQYNQSASVFDKLAIHSSPANIVNVKADGSEYLLSGNAYAAYQDLQNYDLSYQGIKLQSRYVPDDENYAIAIDGPSIHVQEIVGKYSISDLGRKQTPDGKYLTFFGEMSKQNLLELLDENSVEQLKSKQVTLSSLGGFTTSDKEGTIIEVDNLNSFLKDHDQELAKEMFDYEQKKLKEIITAFSNDVQRLER